MSDRDKVIKELDLYAQDRYNDGLAYGKTVERERIYNEAAHLAEEGMKGVSEQGSYMTWEDCFFELKRRIKEGPQ